ncbi:MAG: glycogen debranching enzyme N-terminal domain-containing protein, partial [Acidobacteria bacterium]|nr:glycogen debranching enzyme N-terminal domain-containing protein [Acidobacteriota bacterium]
MISFDSKICTDYLESSSREWLETNGIGGFASSTISCANTRRYHGLLTAATDPPLGRITMLSKYEETLSIDDTAYELSANQYSGTVHPKGYRYLKSFSLDPFPVWIYEIEGVEIERKIFMVNGKNTTVCTWSILSKIAGRDREVILTLKPLLSFVDYHSLQHETKDFDREYALSPGMITIRPRKDLPTLRFLHNARKVEKTGYWYRGFEYDIERSRGFDFKEDLFQPFSMEFDLDKDVEVLVSTESENTFDVRELETAEKLRREQLIEIAAASDDLTKQLVLAADQFIVSRGGGDTIIAGYPWFSDWGRDTMIALPGLTLATNREGIAKNILQEFSKYISRGMIPNRFPDEGNEPEYNTVDATLWFIEAVRAYLEKTGDYDFVKEHLYEKLVEIIYWHQKGTRFNIHLDEDGLLFSGEEGLQLTWMDAKYGDDVFTPRIGKPVEIQALWYNALKVMTDLAKRFKDKDGKHIYDKLAKRAKKTFYEEFWYDDEECLCDGINGDLR